MLELATTDLQYKMFLLNFVDSSHSSAALCHLQYKMFLLNSKVDLIITFPVLFTIQNVSIKSEYTPSPISKLVKFTIQNVSIKFAMIVNLFVIYGHLQYKMFLLNLILPKLLI